MVLGTPHIKSQNVSICLLNSLYWTLRLELDSPTKAMSALTTSGGEVTHENSIKKREIEKNQIF